MKKEAFLISIITPYYDSLDYIKKLAEVLQPQLTNETEWIIVDDGCNEEYLDTLNAKVIHLEKNSGGASKPRNVGLDIATGEYIAFIDSDDLVSDKYIEEITNKATKGFDYFYIGFLISGDPIIIKDRPPSWNCCVWNTIYKSSIIGKERFDENLVLAEDYDFNKRVRKGTYSSIKKVLYYYSFNPNSLTKKSRRNNGNSI